MLVAKLLDLFNKRFILVDEVLVVLLDVCIVLLIVVGQLGVALL